MSDMPEHVDETAGGPICRHCGGSVDKEGFSTGGLVTDDTGEFEPVGDVEADETEQHEDVEKKRALAFTDAVRRSRR